MYDLTDLHASIGPFKANTSFPILYIANSADNITPEISARNNSEGFTNSVVLVQNAYGVSIPGFPHCRIFYSLTLAASTRPSQRHRLARLTTFALTSRTALYQPWTQRAKWISYRLICQ